MTRLSTAFALLALIAGSAISAQTPPADQPSATPSTQAPGSTAQTPATSESKPETQALKDCIAKQRATDPKLSEADAKRVCKEKDKTM